MRRTLRLARIRFFAVAAALLSPLAACDHDSPTAPDGERDRLSHAPALTAAASPVTTFACTRSWASATNGVWSDAGMWSPAGVPVDSDSVCIDTGGTYEVVLDVEAEVASLRLGGASGVATLVLEDDLTLGEGLVIETSGVLEIDGANESIDLGQPWNLDATAGPEWFVNRGRVEVEPTCACSPLTQWSFKTYVNEGWLFLAGPMDLGVIGRGPPSPGYGRDFENRGFVLTEGSDTVHVTGIGPWPTTSGGYFRMEAGTVAGSVPVAVRNFYEIAWSGGSIPTLSNAPSQALFSTDSDVTFLDPGLFGTVEVFDHPNVTGEMGPDVHMLYHLERSTWSRFEGVDWDDPFVNEGLLELVFDTLVSPRIDAFHGWRNRGTISFSGGGTLAVESFTDEFRNEGDITGAGALTVQSFPFVATAASSVTVPLRLEDASLRGAGTLGTVTATGSSRIAPGSASSGLPLPVRITGTLTFATLVLAPSTTVELDIGGSGLRESDRLVVTGSLVLDGALVVNNDPTYQAGVCGEVVPIITGTGSKTSGAFTSTKGLQVSKGRGWRIHEAGGVLSLVGYRPGTQTAVAVPGALALTEGGAGVTYHICLGSTAPQGPVTLDIRSETGEVGAPVGVVFDTADWMLPAAVTVQPIDDAVAEGIHADTLTHTFGGKDPYYGAAAPFTVPIVITDNEVAADLELIRASQEDNQFVGDTLTTVFRVTNHGPDPSTGTVVTSTPVGGLTFLSATGAACTANGAGEVTCVLASLAPGAQADIAIDFYGAAAGLHSSTWTASGSEPDPQAGNNAVVYTQRVN